MSTDDEPGASGTPSGGSDRPQPRPVPPPLPSASGPAARLRAAASLRGHERRLRPAADSGADGAAAAGAAGTPERGGAAAPRPARRRWQPTSLGLFGIMLATMCVTLLLIQAFAGTFRPGGSDSASEPGPEGAAPPPAGTVRVMIAGDSISQGSSGDYTWRYRLWKHLTEDSGLNIDFVGPYDDLLAVNSGDPGDHHYADPDFDTAHASIWGASAGEIAEAIGEQVAEYRPDYLLVMAGTNELVRGGEADDALNGIRDVVDTARVAQGDIRFVIGELTPVRGGAGDEAMNARIAQFNAALPEVAAQLDGEESPVAVARTADGYDAAEDNWDPAHPNARGELKIAAAFADTLASALDLGDPYPRPLPEVEVGPRERPQVAAANDGGAVTLTWDPVPGATHYRVLQQRLSPDPDELVQLPMDIPAAGEGELTARVENLLSGARYEFIVRPYKGGDAGLGSEAVRIAADEEPPAAPEWVRVNTEGTHLVWAAVPEAGHFEIWRRPLDCSPGSSVRGAPPDPPAGAAGSPSGAGAAAERRCEPADEDGPPDGEGWVSVGLVDGDRRWPIATDGEAGYEFAVRSHRDYVEGAVSDPVEFVTPE
ncbi:GDSL-type esterase/lipase family protein [Nocardiopsis sediminis]|uniref:GDSL-type esterase/lipase family protein n=1 Tax=Nocardiopsis sediminis TaxID=1778267 RepID=A0ABV8FFP8_9ACTN